MTRNSAANQIVTNLLVYSVVGFRAGSIKETAIIDDDIEEEEEEEANESDIDDSRDRSLSCEEFNKIMEYSDRVCSDLLLKSTAAAVEELPCNDKEVTLDDIAQYSSVSEYSNFLLSRILNDAGLNGMSKDLENTFVMSRNSRNFLEMQGIEGLADNSSSDSSSTRSLRTSEEVSPGNRISGLSTASTLSAVSDSSNDSDLSVTPTVTVTESGATCYNFPPAKDENSNTDVAAVVKPYRNNGGLESIQEVSDTTENDDSRYVDDSDDSSLKSEKRSKFYIDSELEDIDQKSEKNATSEIHCNGKVDSKKTHASVQGTYSSSSTRSSNDFSYDQKFVCGRKESTVSTQSGESLPDEDEERDVISEFKKREEKLTAYGSSLRLNVGGKKVFQLKSLMWLDASAL